MTPEALARVLYLAHYTGCDDECWDDEDELTQGEWVRTARAALAALTPAPAQGETLCERCERAIDPQEQGGYVEQVALGRLRVPYHRRCWDENEHALDPTPAPARARGK